jgi:hypothetical protein
MGESSTAMVGGLGSNWRWARTGSQGSLFHCVLFILLAQVGFQSTLQETLRQNVMQVPKTACSGVAKLVTEQTALATDISRRVDELQKITQQLSSKESSSR